MLVGRLKTTNIYIDLTKHQKYFKNFTYPIHWDIDWNQNKTHAINCLSYCISTILKSMKNQTEL